MSDKKDYYEVLNINKSATDEEIKKAYKKMAVKYHPDRNKEKDAEEKFKEINEAYSILSDPEKRKVYDTFGFAGLEGQGMKFNGDFNNVFSSIFEDMFGGGMGDIFGGFKKQNRKPFKRPIEGDDIIKNITIGFNDSVYGCVRKVEVSINVKCSDCQGLGGKSVKNCDICGGTGRIRKMTNQGFMQFIREEQCSKCEGKGEIIEEKCTKCSGNCYNKITKTLNVKIPKGQRSNGKIIYRNEGHCGFNGGKNGDIIFIITVKDHKLFLRKEDNVYLDLPIIFTDALLGCKKTIPTIYGNYELIIPQYTQNGQTIILDDYGFENTTSHIKGKMYILITIAIPKNISNEDMDKIKSISHYETPETKRIKNFIN